MSLVNSPEEDSSLWNGKINYFLYKHSFSQFSVTIGIVIMCKYCSYYFKDSLFIMIKSKFSLGLSSLTNLASSTSLFLRIYIN